MKGFFSAKEINPPDYVGGKGTSCYSCGLYKGATNPRIEPYGKGSKGIMIISDYPDLKTDEKAVPWFNRDGRLLKRELRRLGIDLYEDCITIHSIFCYKAKAPNTKELNNCYKRVYQMIQEYMPKLIILLGDLPVESVIGSRWKKGLDNIHKWRGWTIPDQDFKCWVCPTFHPKQVVNADKQVTTIWKNDLKRIVDTLDKYFPTYKKPEIKTIKDLSILDELKGMLAIDYETTGLKPHAPGHRIISTSVSPNPDESYVFLMPKTRKERMPLLRLLADPRRTKTAHNIKFEHAWSDIRLKQPVHGWEWDSMLAAHMIDNRTGVTSLKFQSYVYFGIIDYSSDVSGYLQSVDKKNGNALNTITDLLKSQKGIEQLLYYNAMDTALQYKLSLEQMKQLDYNFLPF